MDNPENHEESIGDLVSVEVQGRNMRITAHSPLIVPTIQNALSIPDPQAYFKKSRSAWLEKTWDGRIHHYEAMGDGTFEAPLGLVGRLVDAFSKQGYNLPVQYADAPVHIPYHHIVSGRNADGSAFALDPLQVEVCKILLKSRICSIELDTASGKTEIFANAVACFHKENPSTRIMIVVPKRALLRQTKKRLQARLPSLKHEIGALGDGLREIDRKIVVATPDTASAPERINNREEVINYVGKVGLLVLDEAHRSRSNKWQQVIDRVPPASLVWALSGKVTFYAASEKHKQMALEAIFGPPAYSGGNRERLCPVKVIFYDMGWRMDSSKLTGGVTDGTYVKWRKSKDDAWRNGIWRGPDQEGNVPPDMIDDRGRKMKHLYGIWSGGEVLKPQPSRSNIIYFTIHDIALMEYAPRNRWAVDLARTFFLKGETFLVTVQRKRHAVKLWNRMRRAGMDVVLITGDMTGSQQETAIARMNSRGAIGAIAIHSIMSEGVDVPNLIHLIKMDGLSGEQILEQQKGRVQRICAGKECGVVHIPFDGHTAGSKRACTKMRTYFRRRDIPVAVSTKV